MSSVSLSSSSLSSLLGSSTTSSSTSSVNLSSLLQVATGSSSSGIDVTAAVAAAIAAARGPEVQWQAQQKTLQGQESDLNTLNTQTTTLEGDLYSLDNSFDLLASSSSNSSVATAYAAPGAASGSYTLSVTSLATTSSWYSTTTAATSSTGLSAGSFTLQVGSGGTANPITIASGETLDQLASDINSQHLGVSASVVTDASGARLSIVSNSSGSASNITIANTAPQLTKQADGSWNSASVADPNSTALTAGSFSIQVGSGAANPLTVTSGETLNQLAAAINAQSSTLGVTANVVADSNGTTSHLQIVNNTGDTSAIAITNTSPQFAQATPGANAVLSVNGIPMSSASNTVTGAVTGMTFNLTGTGSNVIVSVAANTSAITSAVSQFVTDYNTLIGSVNSEYTYSASNSTAQPLSGDSTLGLLQDTLLGAGSYSSGSGSYSTLGALGITMNNDGTLTLDSNVLSSAIQNNSAAVQQFFEGSALNGFSSALNTQLQALTEPTTGAFSVDLTGMQGTYNDLQDQINNFETNYIAALQTNLTAEYSAAEIALQNINIQKQQINAELGNNTNSGN